MPTIKQMKKVAKKSDHSLYMHCTLIYAGSRLIASGYNKQDVHAEIAALKKLFNWLRVDDRRSPRNLHAVNIMLRRKTGMFGNSAPCKECLVAFRMAGIKSFTYYDGKEFIEV